MCGIAGVVGTIDRIGAEKRVRKMLCAMARRGPDSEGLETWDSAVFGHRRLAIFDLSSAGNQPMLSNNGSVGIVFNGAIYNYRELRKDLILRGYSFQSDTDTEVLINGYQAWGIDQLVQKLRGMFAFALWDNDQRKLYLVRDRLGVKPLVFTLIKGGIAFASTVRALRAAGYVGEIDINAVIDFLGFGFVTDDHSIYREAIKVPAGTVLEWSEGITERRSYWQYPLSDSSSRLSFQEAVDETERLLLTAVEVRLHADVPVGALLSGGVDSSLVCWAVAKLGGDITAYTIGTPGHEWDESAAATDTARKLGIAHKLLPIDDGEPLELQSLVSAYAEPFACASALGMLRVSRAVASSAKVLLTGDGGDDVFLGYPPHRNLWIAENLGRWLPAMAKSSWRAMRSVIPERGPLRRAAALMDFAAGGLDAVVSRSNTLPAYRTQGLLGDRLANSPQFEDIAWSPNGTHAVLEQYLAWERKHWFVSEFMTKVDGATMHYGLEARSPFLDHTIWEFACSLPSGLRLRRGRLKAILRELARRKIGWAVASRKKQGFGIPVQRWMAGQWRPLIKAALQDSILGKEGWISADTALRQLNRVAENGSAPQHLWYIFVLESWMKYERFGTV